MSSREIQCAVTCNSRGGRDCRSASLQLSKIQGRLALKFGSRRRDETARCRHPSGPGRTPACTIVLSLRLRFLGFAGRVVLRPLRSGRPASQQVTEPSEQAAEIPSACLGRSLSPPGGKECPALNLWVGAACDRAGFLYLANDTQEGKECGERKATFVMGHICAVLRFARRAAGPAPWRHLQQSLPKGENGGGGASRDSFTLSAFSGLPELLLPRPTSCTHRGGPRGALLRYARFKLWV